MNKWKMVFGIVLVVLAVSVGGARATCVNLTEHGNQYVVNDNSILCQCTYLMNNTETDYAILINASNVVFDCNNSNIIGNGSGKGIYVSEKENVTIANCNLMNFTYGIRLGLSTENILKNNNANLNEIHGIYLDASSNNTLQNNTANSNKWYGIHLSVALGNIIKNNTMSSNERYGLSLYSNSTNNDILENTLALNNVSGIHLRKNSSDNQLKNNIIHSNKEGIWIHSSSNNTIINNNASSNDKYGIRLSNESSENIIENNTANLNGHYGIVLFLSTDNAVIKNIVNSNIERHGIVLYRSSNNNITHNLVSLNNISGIQVSASLHNNIHNNTAVLNVKYGISLYSNATDNTLSNNNASSNEEFGIYIRKNSNRTIVKNNIVNSNYRGFWIHSSSNNTLKDNNASLNEFGILITNKSWDNLIYNNYFSNNTYNARDDCTNFWNITKTRGTNIIGGPYIAGNYWSDYTGNDTNKNGLGNTLLPYNSSGNIQNGGDSFPLVYTSVIFPEIQSTDPLNESENIPVNKTISITFNKEINRSSINESTFYINKINDGSNISANLLTADNITFILNPIENLEYLTEYIVTLENGTKDMIGLETTSTHAFTFTTEKEELEEETIETIETRGGILGSSIYPPVIESIPDITTVVGEIFTLTVRVNYLHGSGENLTFSDNTPLFNINKNTGSITFTPTEEHIGEHTITIAVRDDYNTDSETFTLTINPAEEEEPVEEAEEEVIETTPTGLAIFESAEMKTITIALGIGILGVIGYFTKNMWLERVLSILKQILIIPFYP